MITLITGCVPLRYQHRYHCPPVYDGAEARLITMITMFWVHISHTQAHPSAPSARTLWHGAAIWRKSTLPVINGASAPS